jgi:hypothetical protein
MATKKNDARVGIEVPFVDGAETIYPVSLRTLRKLMKALKTVDLEEEANNEISDDQLDAMVAAAAIILEKYRPDIVQEYNKKKEEGDENAGEAIEELLDMRSFGMLIAAGMGADPKEFEKVQSQA